MNGLALLALLAAVALLTIGRAAGCPACHGTTLDTAGHRCGRCHGTGRAR